MSQYPAVRLIGQILLLLLTGIGPALEGYTSGNPVASRVYVNGAGAPAVDLKFVYGGWNLIKITTGSSGKAQLRALDLSGTEQGAGGVAGLLCLIILPWQPVSLGMMERERVELTATDSTTTADEETPH